MKFAIFGDIHANLEAFDAVLAEASSQGATDFACIGDVVNFNADPAECVRHTHMQKVFRKRASVTVENTECTVIEPGFKYFINVGSVGQPRDGDWRSAYALYDQDNRTVSIRRVPFEIKTTQRKNREAGLG